MLLLRMQNGSSSSMHAWNGSNSAGCAATWRLQRGTPVTLTALRTVLHCSLMTDSLQNSMGTFLWPCLAPAAPTVPGIAAGACRAWMAHALKCEYQHGRKVS